MPQDTLQTYSPITVSLKAEDKKTVLELARAKGVTVHKMTRQWVLDALAKESHEQKSA